MEKKTIGTLQAARDYDRNKVGTMADEICDSYLHTHERFLYDLVGEFEARNDTVRRMFDDLMDARPVVEYDFTDTDILESEIERVVKVEGFPAQYDAHAWIATLRMFDAIAREIKEKEVEEKNK